jgi:hypothetical protein
VTEKALLYVFIYRTQQETQMFSYILPTESQNPKDFFWITMFLRMVYGALELSPRPETEEPAGFTISTEKPISEASLERLGLIPLKDP